MRKDIRNILVTLTVIAMFATSGAGAFAIEGTEDPNSTPAAVSDEPEGSVDGQPEDQEIGEPEAGIEAEPEEGIEAEPEEEIEAEPEAGIEAEEATEAESAEQPAEPAKMKASAAKTNFSVDRAIGCDRVILMWDAAKGKSYKVTCTKKGEKESAKNVATINKATSPCVVSKLEPATQYKFVIESTDKKQSDTIFVTTKSKPLKVVSPKLFSSRDELQLEWPKVKGADAYIVYRAVNNGSFKYYITLSPRIKNSYDSYKDGKCVWRNVKGISNTKKYRYRVKAVQFVEDEDGFIVKNHKRAKNNYKRYFIQNQSGTQDVMGKFSKPTKKKTCVKPMYIYVKPRMNRRLTSRDTYQGNHKSHTFKRGESIKCYGYTDGCYYFKKKIAGHSYVFRIARVNSYGQKAIYVGNHNDPYKGNYTRHEAELFVNSYMKAHKKFDSYGKGKNYCIWVSYYTQHMYILKRSGGKWVMATSVNDSKFVRDSWECSTGKASTPSYTGNNRINPNRARSLKGISYWNGYHGKKDKFGNFNGIHGKQKSYVLGEPHSHACIRNNNKNAKLIWDAKIIGAAVICY